MPQQDDDAAELDESEVVLCLALPSRRYSAPAFEPSKKAFNFPTTPVPAHLPSILFPCAWARSAPSRSNKLDVAFIGQAGCEFSAVKRLVADQQRRYILGEAGFEGLVDESDIVS